MAEIQRLRDELQAKERALQLLRKDAIDQQYLLQLLERDLTSTLFSQALC